MKKRTTRDAPYEVDHFVDTFSELADIFNFSLRTQEQCFSQFCIVLRTTPPNYKLYPTLLAGLICIKTASSDLYRRFVAGKLEASKLVSYIGQTPAGQAFLYSDEGMVLEALLMASKCRRGELQQARSPYEKIFKDKEISEIERQKAQRILELFNYINQQSEYGVLNYLSKKIEISDQFSKD